MRPTKIPILPFGLMLAILFVSCGPQKERGVHRNMPEPPVQAAHAQDAQVQADLALLRKKKTDTIVVYRRGLWGCCDFYTLLYSAGGETTLAQFYIDSALGKVKEEKVMPDNGIFHFIHDQYEELRSSRIRENSHLDSKGITTQIDPPGYYWYTQVTIYTPKDSIISGEMRDHYFKKYVAGDNPNEVPNDNYRHNISSPWNTLLTTIEHEIAKIPQTPATVKRELRTTKHETSHHL